MDHTNNTQLATIQNGQVQVWRPTDEDRGIIRETIAAEADDSQFDLFMSVIAATGLNPLVGQIHAVFRKSGKYEGYGDKKRWVESPTKAMTIQIGIHGLRLIAQRTGTYRGQIDPQWCGEDGVWKDVWLSKTEYPSAARWGVIHRDFEKPMAPPVLFSEYCPMDKQSGQPTGLWKTMPANQLIKCAAAAAFRATWPMETQGTYLKEEMERTELEMVIEADDGASEAPAAPPEGKVRAGRPRAAPVAAQAPSQGIENAPATSSVAVTPVETPVATTTTAPVITMPQQPAKPKAPEPEPEHIKAEREARARAAASTANGKPAITAHQAMANQPLAASTATPAGDNGAVLPPNAGKNAGKSPFDPTVSDDFLAKVDRFYTENPTVCDPGEEGADEHIALRDNVSAAIAHRIAGVKPVVTPLPAAAPPVVQPPAPKSSGPLPGYVLSVITAAEAKGLSMKGAFKEDRMEATLQFLAALGLQPVDSWKDLDAGTCGIMVDAINDGTLVWPLPVPPVAAEVPASDWDDI